MCAFALTVGAAQLSAQSRHVATAIEWYDGLGFPNVSGLQYVRVATGGWSQDSGQRESRFVEGYLIREDTESFTVFLCSVSKFESIGPDYDQPFAPLRTVRFVRKATGPAYEHVRYEIEDFRQVASEVLTRVRERVAATDRQRTDLRWHRARIFSFARAALQQGLSEIAYPLMEIAAALPDPQDDSIVRPARLRAYLQELIGDAVLTQAELDAANPDVPWTELLKTYDGFDKRFPANPEIAYARAAAKTLKRMIAEDAAHNPKSLDQMSTGEQVAENIYQLRNLRYYPWNFEPGDQGDTLSPVYRLRELGFAAVPQLIEALDDHRFTHAMHPVRMGPGRDAVLRVSNFAEDILSFIAGRNISIRVGSDGKPLRTSVRQAAETWWKEVQKKGERQQLIDDVSAGGDIGTSAW